MCSAQHSSDKTLFVPTVNGDFGNVRGDLNSWVLRTPLSLFGAIGSVTGCPKKGACHWVTAGFATCRVRYVRVRYMFSTA